MMRSAARPAHEDYIVQRDSCLRWLCTTSAKIKVSRSKGTKRKDGTYSPLSLRVRVVRPLVLFPIRAAEGPFKATPVGKFTWLVTKMFFRQRSRKRHALRRSRTRLCSAQPTAHRHRNSLRDEEHSTGRNATCGAGWREVEYDCGFLALSTESTHSVPLAIAITVGRRRRRPRACGELVNLERPRCRSGRYAWSRGSGRR